MLHSNSAVESERTLENAGTLNEQPKSQMTKKFDEMKSNSK